MPSAARATTQPGACSCMGPQDPCPPPRKQSIVDRMWALLRVATVLVAAASTPLGCAPTPVDLRPVTSVQDDYDDVLDRWTRSTESYDGFKSSLFVGATLFGPELSEAWLREQARLYHQDEETATSTRSKLEEETARTHRFFVALFTNETRWNDLDRPNPAFRMWLSTDMGPRVAPVSIERVRDRNQTVQALFPYLGPFRQGYYVRFPREASEGVPTIPNGATRVTLEVTGPHGTATLNWEVAGPR